MLRTLKALERSRRNRLKFAPDCPATLSQNVNYRSKNWRRQLEHRKHFRQSGDPRLSNSIWEDLVEIHSNATRGKVHAVDLNLHDYVKKHNMVPRVDPHPLSWKEKWRVNRTSFIFDEEGYTYKVGNTKAAADFIQQVYNVTRFFEDLMFYKHENHLLPEKEDFILFVKVRRLIIPDPGPNASRNYFINSFFRKARRFFQQLDFSVRPWCFTSSKVRSSAFVLVPEVILT